MPRKLAVWISASVVSTAQRREEGISAISEFDVITFADTQLT